MANNTSGGSWWKQIVEWGSDVYDSAGNWWDDSFGDMDYSDLKSTTGIGGRGIDIPSADQMGSSGTGFGWLDTTLDYVEDAYDYGKTIVGYGKDVLDWTGDVYKGSPQWVKDWVAGRGKSKGGDGRQRLRERAAMRRNRGMPQGAATRNIGLGRRQTQAFRPQAMGKGGYGNNPLANAIMKQARQNDRIMTTLSGQVRPGGKTIGINQARINMYLAKRYGLSGNK